MHNIVSKNSKYILSRLETTNEKLQKFPLYFLIETLNICNAKCIMCPVEISKRKKGNISDSLFKKIVFEIHQHIDNVRQVALFLLGEPLLDKKIFHRIKQLKNIKVSNVLLASNASLLTQENIEKLLESGLDQIYISIDGSSKETYEAIKTGLNFETVTNNVINLIQYRNNLKSGLRIRLQMILQKKNLNEAQDWKSHWGKLIGQLDELKIIKVSNWGTQLDIDDFGIGELKTPCVSPFGTFVIQHNGDVSLCCADFDCKVLMGNVKKQSIYDIWHSNKFEHIRKNFLSGTTDIPICKKCNVWRDDKYYND